LPATVDDRGGVPGDEELDLSCARADSRAAGGLRRSEEGDLGSAEVEVTAEDPTDTLELTGDTTGSRLSEGAGQGGLGEEESPLSLSRKLMA